MSKAGQASDCVSHPSAERGAQELPEEQRQALPGPGEVGLMMGGPPCQVRGLGKRGEREGRGMQT